MNIDHLAQNIHVTSMQLTSDEYSSYLPCYVLPNVGSEFINSSPKQSTTSPFPSSASPALMHSTSTVPSKPMKKLKPPKIRRPCNSFFLYLRDKQIELGHVLKEKPRQNMTKIVGELWKQESEELRSIYKAMADEIKLVHLEHYPGYKYQPEKKVKTK
ncbi:hypothetical protein HMI55_007202 [Coelomomyces lativittatus]|nr:hypothetical protein HMI55_007199 [Coelomomyces lativittatus]KAJ1517398.1 hypothetical protein HMI55_007202 [Coelomomyces lativittatus]